MRKETFWGMCGSLLLLLGLVWGYLLVEVGCMSGYEACREVATPSETSRGTPVLHQIPELGQILELDRFTGPDAPSIVASPDTELWIIARPEAPPEPVAADEEAPGCGALMAVIPDPQAEEEKEVPVPLKHTAVKGRISGYIATVQVTQQFHNPYDSKIEAVYVFPLPQNAAINEFLMTIGERKIRGIIREREEAEAIYLAARDRGYAASLMTQQRPNIFTQKVANIEPGKSIAIDIKYFHTLAYLDGWYQFVFPMVVGPRFNPPGSTDGVGAVARGKQGLSGQKTEVQYLKPNERSGHDISLSLELDAGVKIEKLLCASHVVDVESDEDRALVRLSQLDAIPNKDFVLLFKVAGEKIKSALMTHQDERGGYFTMMLYPPESLENLARKPMEMVFVLDCSGSMSGQPIAQAKRAIKRALQRLGPEDTFQLIRFSNDASRLGRAPLAATVENVRKGLRYLRSLEGSGGTMMIEGIKAALDFPHDPRRLRTVAFLTDGFIGNEAQILEEVHKRLGATRIFSFGVGSSPNRYLMERMARLGRGVVAYVGLNDSAVEVMDLFFDRISHPALMDLTVDWGDWEVKDVFPQNLPDLFVGRPVVITGRYRGEPSGTIRIRGSVGDQLHEVVFRTEGDSRAQHKGIPFVWARRKIAELAELCLISPDSEIPDLIKEVALEYGLMSEFTAFVAVDSTRRTEGDSGTTVPVPVPVPDGVKYETTVQEEE